MLEIVSYDYLIDHQTNSAQAPIWIAIGDIIGMMVARAIIPAQIHTWENLLFQKLKIKTSEIFFPNTRTRSSITLIYIPIRNLYCYHGAIRKSRCQFMIDILRWQIRCEFILIKKISTAYLNSHFFDIVVGTIITFYILPGQWKALWGTPQELWRWMHTLPIISGLRRDNRLGIWRGQNSICICYGIKRYWETWLHLATGRNHSNRGGSYAVSCFHCWANDRRIWHVRIVIIMK